MAEEKFEGNRRNIFQFLFYVCMTIVNFFQINWLNVHMKIPLNILITYLTCISLFLNTIYYSFKTVKFFFIKKIEKTHPLDDAAFKFIFMVSFTVVTVFWSNQLLGTYYVVPKERVFPALLEFLTHGFNFIMNLIELFSNSRNGGDKLKIWHSIIFFGCYISYLKIEYLRKGFAPYPVIGGELFNKGFLIVYMSGNIIFVCSHYFYDILRKKEKSS